ncbi:hypothetical protein [Caulobacter sp. 1776]|uniref:hypothetical protein n=1 Tax=Caulobacter sp. 1776 TaxID=3156420 RepID=UPI0033950E6C
MFLYAFVFAAALQAAPAAPAPPPQAQSRRSFNVAAARASPECRQRAMKARDDATAKGQPLNRMPPGLLHHTVIRMVDGCPVSTQVRQSGPAR